jgi:hypothetical protein
MSIALAVSDKAKYIPKVADGPLWVVSCRSRRIEGRGRNCILNVVDLLFVWILTAVRSSGTVVEESLSFMRSC